MTRILVCATAFLTGAISAVAQDGPKEKFTQAQKENAAQLRQYQWMSRTELKLKGETKNVKEQSVRYDMNGQLQKTTIESTPQSQPSGGRLKERMIEKKKEEFAELMQGLGGLAQSYAHMTPDQTRALAQSATLSRGQGTMDGTIQLQGANAVVQGDKVALWIDPSTFLMRQVKIDSLYENNPVNITVAYQRVPNGPNYPAQTDLKYPKKEVELIVSNSNYQRLTGSVTSPGVSAAAPAAVAAAATQGWPRQHVKDGTTLVIYQPQVDNWQDFKTLEWRMAVTLTQQGGKPAVGAISMEGQTDVDTVTHAVTIHDMKIVHAEFPSLPADTQAQLTQKLTTFLPNAFQTTLDQVVACTPKPQSTKTVQLNNDSPQIFVSYKPAILVDVAGEPVFVPFQKSNLEYAMNTSWRLFHDKTNSHYYVLAGTQWMTATDLNGPWSATTQLPAEMANVAQDEHFSDLKNAVPPPAATSDSVVPTVFYATTPAEIILFSGAPAYTPIQNTHLSYATNTVSYVFKDSATQNLYFLTSGRWFSAATLGGPWTFATPNLPADFAKIPQSSPAAQVLASVPGTEEAKDAVLMAQIPTTAVVNPTQAAAAAKVAYDGQPKFVPIQGTSMQYATNTPQKVILVGDVYYLCLNGVWFFATTPQGPWQTAPSVPKEIYTIPPSSPVYNVTYVTQVTTSSGGIEASYTAGYLGAFVIGATVGAVIAGGTGYYYPPYVGYYPGFYGYPAYYAAPCTYGGVAYHNNVTGAYGVSQTAYGPYGSATRTASYNPYTGTSTRTASVATPYGRQSVGQAYNPYTGAYGETHQGSNAYSQWGSSAVTKNGQTAYSQHYSDARGTAGSVQTSSGGAAAGAVGRNGNSAVAGKTSSGDMYAGHDGNVYKNTGSGWQKYDNGSWNNVNKPSSQQFSQEHSSQMQSLQSEQQNRMRGEQSSERFQQRSFGGGGGHFGGFRR